MTQNGGAPALSIAASDTVVAIQNAFKLGSSLVLTWAVALGVRIVLPRYLGPEAFGVFQFADAFSTTCFVVTSLGIDTYVRKEVPVRPNHASEFFGGVLFLRVAVGVLILAFMALVLRATGRSADVRMLVYIFAGAQFFVTLNGTYSSLLHAISRVDGLSVLNVASKITWGVGIVIGFWCGAGLYGVAASLLLSELFKTMVLGYLAQRHMQLSLQIDMRATKTAVVLSVPYFLNFLAHTVYAKLDVSIMAFLVGDQEVGWYGAASNVAGLALMLTPLIGWVLLPMTSRAAVRSIPELEALMRRALELIMLVAIPTSLLLGLWADVLVTRVFGAAFAPAVMSLRILAPMFVLTYVAMVSSTFLIRLEKGWTVTAISALGLVVNPGLNLLLIPWAAKRFGVGGAGVGAATTLIATELMVSVLMMWQLGRRAYDARLVRSVGKTCLVALAVIAIDRAFASLELMRLVIDGVAYVALAAAIGAVNIEEIAQYMRLAMSRRGEHAISE